MCKTGEVGAALVQVALATLSPNSNTNGSWGVKEALFENC